MPQLVWTLLLTCLLLIGNLSMSPAAEKLSADRAYKFGVFPYLSAVHSVDSCFQQLLIDAPDACVAPPFAPAVIEEKMNVRLRVLLETPAIPNLSIVAHSRLPPDEREWIVNTMWREHSLVKSGKNRHEVFT